MTNDHTVNEKKEKRFGCLQVLGLMLLAVIITAGVTLQDSLLTAGSENH